MRTTASRPPTSVDTAESHSCEPTSDNSRPPATLSPLSPVSPWPPEPVPEDVPQALMARETESSPTPTLPTAKEVYGSLAVLLTYISGGAYLIWALAPIGWLDQFGWTWYPDREWAVIVPCYMMLIVLLTYWSYTAMAAFNTPPFASPALITDPYARIPGMMTGKDPYYWRFADPEAIPEAIDLPIDLVNRVLYPARPRPAARELTARGGDHGESYWSGLQLILKHKSDDSTGYNIPLDKKHLASRYNRFK